MTRTERPKIVQGRGPRACEAYLFNAIDHDLEQLGDQVLQRPIVVVVPSHSLRHHLLDRLVHERGSVVGVVARTLHGIATEILERAGRSSTPGDVWLPVVVRREARQQEPLRACLEHLQDGYAGLTRTVVDLLEAGLDPVHLEALEESLTAEGRLVATAAEVRRAISMIRVAARVADNMKHRGFDTDTTLLAEAAEMLRTGTQAPLRTSRLYLHGFADATGLATDFVLELLATTESTVLFDRPPDPIDWRRDPVASEFGRHFSERLTDRGGLVAAVVPAPEAPTVSLISALGTESEVREIAWRIRRRLDAGTRAESIAVVARRLEPYRSAIRRHFGRLGIPFSAVDAVGPALPAARQVAALLEILTRRQGTRIERWLDTRQQGFGEVPLFDLRLALHGLGIGRLEELAAWSFEAERREALPLPSRLGFSAESETEGSGRLTRRRIPTQVVRQAQNEVRDLCALLDRWSECRRWQEHRRTLERWLAHLGWASDRPPGRELLQALEEKTSRFPDDLELDLDEWTLVLEQCVSSIGMDRLGGVGGGVQILDVIEARSRTFEDLFILGLNKGVFPRTVREDPAFPDSLRHVLGREGHGVLPDLVRKGIGHAEERHLFVQLLASAPRVTLSWQDVNDDNSQVSPSPLIERLLFLHRPEKARSPLADPASDPEDREPRTAHESAIRAALWGSQRNLRANLKAAIPIDQAELASELSRVRLAVVDEVDRAPATNARLGPYFGLVGAVSDPADPRHTQDLYVTTLESLSVCPWRTFLERLLRLEPLPDPIEVLPGLDPVFIGQLVHRALEHLIERGIDSKPESLADARARTSRDVPWPNRDELLDLVRYLADQVAGDQGVSWPGFGDILARVAIPHLEVAHQLLWESGGQGLPVAAEIEGELRSPGGAEGRLRFRADAVFNDGGRLILSDFKTGSKGISSAVQQRTRDRHLLAGIRQGRLLQAVAYARATDGMGDVGRYVFLHPDLDGPDEARIVDVSTTDPEIESAFDHAVATLVEAWRRGILFPRLVEVDRDEEPTACTYCAVAAACLRGDSGARGILRDWGAHVRGGDDLDHTARRIWQLGSGKEGSS